MILGAVLAGGRSSRFGSDKALARLGGRTLLAHAVEALARQCDGVIVVGRAVAPAPAAAIEDWPRGGMGPLAGIAAALRHAEGAGYTSVLTCAVDSVGIGNQVAAELVPAPAYVKEQPVIGLWPVGARSAVEAILEGTGRHSMRALVDAVGARPVSLSVMPANINTQADLADVRTRWHEG